MLNLNRFRKKIVSGKFLGKFVVKWILKLPPHLAYVATLKIGSDLTELWPRVCGSTFLAHPVYMTRGFVIAMHFNESVSGFVPRVCC